MATKELFLAAVRASLEGKVLQWDQEVTIEEWKEFIKLASLHNVIPMVFESIYGSDVFRKTGMNFYPYLQSTTFRSVLLQTQRTEEFKRLYSFLLSKKLEPIIVKGIMVRRLHPNPDNRPSSDEDFYIPAGTYDIYKAVLLEYGMQLADWDKEKESLIHEVTYISKNGSLAIEIHKDLFDEKLSAFSGMNDLFTDVFERSIQIDVDSIPVRSMNHTDHMLFLILHAFKHFVTGGFGIRQVCDMVVYGNQFGSEISWDDLLKKCQGIHADVFASAIFDIGKKYLGFDWQKSGYSKKWQRIDVDSEHLLADLLDAGLFGNADMSRKHTSNMTLNAVAADKDNKLKYGNFLRVLFPPVEILEGRYAYLHKRPYLILIAWAQRLISYVKMQFKGGSITNEALTSMKLGNERIELLKEYAIIKK